jgi:hypothetical protein
VSTVQSGHTPVASYEVNNKNLRYRVSTLVTKKSERGALVDRGANGGILGADAHVWQKHRQKIDVTGIDNHEMTGLQMVDGTAFVKTQNGPVILIMRQYASENSLEHPILHRRILPQKMRLENHS